MGPFLKALREVGKPALKLLDAEKLASEAVG